MQDEDFMKLLEPLGREVDRLANSRNEHSGKIAGFRQVLQAMNGHDPDGMARKKLEDRIKKEEATLSEIDSALANCRGQMTAIDESMKILGKSTQPSKGLRPNTELSRIEVALRRNGKPMTISAILAELGKEDTKDARNSMRGSLSRYAKDGRIFTKEGDLFGLVEFGGTAEDLIRLLQEGAHNDP